MRLPGPAPFPAQVLAALCVPLLAAPGTTRAGAETQQEDDLEVSVDGSMAPVTARIRLRCPDQRAGPVVHVLTFGPGNDDRITERSTIEVERSFAVTTEVRGWCRDSRDRVRHLLPSTVLVVDEQLQRDSVVALGNAERVRAGVGRLEPDEELNIVAQAHARDMAERRYFAHVNPEGLDLAKRLRRAGIDFRAAGENIGGNSSAAAVVRAWLDSAGHRANLLGNEFTRIGVGVFRTPASPYTYYVQVFAS